MMHHCGRLDVHREHEIRGVNLPGYIEPERLCDGHILTEGAQTCVLCDGPVSACHCYADVVEARRLEWWSE